MGGGYHSQNNSTWQLLCLAVEKPCTRVFGILKG